MYLVKKLISAFLLPLPLGVVLLVAAALLHRRRRPRAARAAAGLALALWLGASCSPVAGALLDPLEHCYAPLPAAPAALQDGPARAVVVLGGGQRQVPGAAANSDLSGHSLARVVEGVRLWRARPDARLYFSGAGQPPIADVAAESARLLGVPDDRIAREPRPRDTEEEAAYLFERLGNARIVLVTSAVHMPRAAALFRKRGFDVLPAPTDFQGAQGLSLADLQPDGGAIDATELAVHEYLGYLWAWLRGRL